MNEVLDLAQVKPIMRTESSLDSLGFGYLENLEADQPYYIACLTNINSFGDPVVDGRLILSDRVSKEILQAVFYTRDQEIVLTINNIAGERVINLPPITGGCFVVIQAGSV